MVISVSQLKEYIQTDLSDKVLGAKLQALELLIRRKTNNNFQLRSYRSKADIRGGVFTIETLTPFKVGDTVQVTESEFNAGLFTVDEITDSTFTVKEDTEDELDVLVTKVSYPIDVVMGVIKMLDWELKNGDKVGIQSESISRHSVTYFNMDGDNSDSGYPKSLLGFLKPYMKARF